MAVAGVSARQQDEIQLTQVTESMTESRHGLAIGFGKSTETGREKKTKKRERGTRTKEKSQRGKEESA